MNRISLSQGRLKAINTCRLLGRICSNWFYKFIRAAILFGIGFTLIYPILFIFTTAFRSREDMWNPSVVWITRNFTLEHIKKLIEVMNYPEVLSYTCMIAIGSAIIQMLVTSMVGYGFARFKFKGKNLLFGLVIFSLIVPVQTYITPLYITFRFFKVPVISQLYSLVTGEPGSLNLLNSPTAFWVQALFGMGMRSGLFIYIFRQFYRGMPADLENAALIDGCGPYRTYLKVMIPNAIPALVTVFMFSLVWHWNDYFSTSILSISHKTIAVALADLRGVILRLQGPDNGDVVLMQIRVQAGAFLAILPMLVLFAFAQRFFTESIERTGIVG